MSRVQFFRRAASTARTRFFRRAASTARTRFFRRAASTARTRARKPFWRRHLVEILGLALLVLVIHDVFGSHGFLAMRRSQKELEQLRGEIERLNQQNHELTDHVNALRTDPKTIERIAREEMGLARPGEMIFKLPPPAAGKPGQQTDPR